MVLPIHGVSRCAVKRLLLRMLLGNWVRPPLWGEWGGDGARSWLVGSPCARRPPETWLLEPSCARSTLSQWLAACPARTPAAICCMTPCPPCTHTHTAKPFPHPALAHSPSHDSKLWNMTSESPTQVTRGPITLWTSATQYYQQVFDKEIEFPGR